MTDTNVLHHAAVIARAMPPHVEHIKLVRAALHTAQNVVIVLGSSFGARSPRNPFTWRERATMFALCLTPEERRRVKFVPIRDYYDNDRWSTAVRHGVTHALGVEIGNRDISLVGCDKDAGNDYLDLFPEWTDVRVPQSSDLCATTIRNMLYGAEDVDIALLAGKEEIYRDVRNYLRAWTKKPDFAELAAWDAFNKKYTGKWGPGPHTAVDSIIECMGFVAMIRRKDIPGRNQLAFPGGFLERDEWIFDGVLRETKEETGFAHIPSEMRRHLDSVRIFDAPWRDERARIISHAHHFKLDLNRHPQLKASSDAKEAVWMNIDHLAAHEDEFFADHFHIADELFHLTRSVGADAAFEVLSAEAALDE